MKQILENLVTKSLETLRKNGDVSSTDSDVEFKIEKTRDARHGDYASNIAMVLAGQLQKNPRDLAGLIINHLPPSEIVDRIEIAGPGFINFYLKQQAYLEVVRNVIDAGDNYGRCDYGNNESILIEFVSANPTGPLHIGHGRGAAYGAATANLLDAVGYKIEKEYYVNDAGRQMDILASSVYLRYLQKCGVDITLPAKAYQGDYVTEIAAKIHKNRKDTLQVDIDDLVKQINDEPDEEEQLDKIIQYFKTNLGNENYQLVYDAGLDEILADIEQDLEEFGVVFDRWFSERKLLASNRVQECIDLLKKNDQLYEQDGALWFRSTDYGDEKDRVVVRENGQLTYFASDIAYHQSKFQRGYSRNIDVWGADHHGYIPRVKASLAALGLDKDKLDVLLVQFASLYRGKVKVQMSTRSGQFVTLRELRDEVGKDAARFFYVMRKSEQHLDFDLELAKSQSQDNPVYYIQYAHARICSVLRQMHEKGMQFDPSRVPDNLGLLEEAHEIALLNRLMIYPESVLTAARDYEPHQIGYYLRDLANEFHTYYNACQILVNDEPLRNARLSLICAVRQVIRNGLDLLGVSAPEVM